MIKEYPDSQPALIDLKRILAYTERQSLLTNSLKTQFDRRLLIAGANTKTVITVYIKLIKAMKLVEPRGVLLETVRYN